jgi:hypothetical protein
MTRHVQLAVVGALLGALVSGCGLLPVTRGDVCADWVLFEKPQDQFNEAALVLIGTPAGRDGETSIYGYTAQFHVVEIETVLKGEPEPGQLQIASMPATCTQGVSYPDGDPLDQRRRMLIYANKQDGYWFTITPAQGAVPLDTGTPLPFATTPAKG